MKPEFEHPIAAADAENVGRPFGRRHRQRRFEDIAFGRILFGCRHVLKATSIDARYSGVS